MWVTSIRPRSTTLLTELIQNFEFLFSASILPATFILAATYAECNHMFAVIFFTLSIGLDAFLPYGLFTNPIDLSPNYSGTIMSIGNACGAVSGIIAPSTVGFLTPNVSSRINNVELIKQYFYVYVTLRKFWFALKCFFFCIIYLVSDLKALLSEWRTVFWITFVIHLLKTVAFTFWGSGKTQPWNERQQKVQTLLWIWTQNIVAFQSKICLKNILYLVRL